MNEFECVSYLLMMFTSSVDETHRWLEMMAMAQEEYRALRASASIEGIFFLYFFDVSNF